MTLVEFLLERITEDEALACGAVGFHWDGHYYREVRTAVGDTPSYYSVTAERQIFEHWDQTSKRVDPGRTYEHIARHDPARVLAECAAKRNVVEVYRALAANRPADGSIGWYQVDAYETVLRTIATVYADHVGYDKKWAL